MLRVFCFYPRVRLGFLKSPTFRIAAVVIAAVCLLQIWPVRFLQRIELMFYDWRVQMAHRMHQTTSSEATNLALVEITDTTIYEVKSDPHLGFLDGLYWPRDVYAAGLKELNDQGAKAVAFDVLFAEERGDQNAVTTADGHVMAPDDIFADQLRASSNAILAAADGQMPASKFLTNAPHIANISVDRDPIDDTLRKDRVFQDFYIWHPLIQQLAGMKAIDFSRTVDDLAGHKITFVSAMYHESYEYPTDADGMIATTNFLDTIPEGFPARFAPYKRKGFGAWELLWQQPKWAWI